MRAPPPRSEGSVFRRRYTGGTVLSIQSTLGVATALGCLSAIACSSATRATSTDAGAAGSAGASPPLPREHDAGKPGSGGAPSLDAEAGGGAPFMGPDARYVPHPG